MNAVKDELDSLVRQIRPQVAGLQASSKQRQERLQAVLKEGIREWGRKARDATERVLSERTPEGLTMALGKWMTTYSLRLAGVRRAYLQEGEEGAALANRIAELPMVKEYARKAAELTVLAKKFRINVPAQIGFDFWLNPPRVAETEEESLEGLSLGGAQNMVWCGLTGELLQESEKDAGRLRVGETMRGVAGLSHIFDGSPLVRAVGRWWVWMGRM